MKILITGAAGLVGGRLCDLLANEHTIVPAARTRVGNREDRAVFADLSDDAQVRGIFDDVRPDAVIHCAAAADAESCEREPSRATRDNEIATRLVTTEASRINARLIAFSTDLVFAGNAALSSEETVAEPISEYGRSKRRAEMAALNACPAAVVLRISLVIGRGFGARLSATEGIIRRLKRGEALSLYQDEWRAPIDPESIAGAVRAVLARPDARGIFHIAGCERLTRFELGLRVARAFNLDESLLRTASRSDHQGAPRPRDASLSIEKARADLDWAPRPLDEALREARTS